jgi:hypothetical protein
MVTMTMSPCSDVGLAALERALVAAPLVGGMGGEHQAGQLAREAAGGARAALARWLSIVTSTTRIGADSARACARRAGHCGTRQGERRGRDRVSG